MSNIEFTEAGTKALGCFVAIFMVLAIALLTGGVVWVWKQIL